MLRSFPRIGPDSGLSLKYVSVPRLSKWAGTMRYLSDVLRHKHQLGDAVPVLNIPVDSGAYPHAVDPALLGSYSAVVKAGGGYVWDDVLEISRLVPPRAWFARPGGWK